MNTIKISELPLLVKEGKIDLADAKNELWSDIYQRPVLYGLKGLTEDQKSDFLMWMSSSFEGLIKNFRQGEIDFFFYVRTCIKRNLNSWIPRILNRAAGDNCICDQIATEYDSISDTFIPVTKKEKIELLKETLSTFTKKQQEIIKTFVHICACRAVNELEEDTMNNICDFLGIDRNLFKTQIEKLKKLTGKKSLNRKKIIEKRNKAFFYHKKFLYELSRLENSSVSYDFIFEKFMSHTANWKKINEELLHRHSASPTTIEISKVTGIKHRQVSFYLNHKKKRKTLYPFIDFPEGPLPGSGEKDK